MRALPLRIACEKNIDVYNVSFSSVYKLTKTNLLNLPILENYQKFLKHLIKVIKKTNKVSKKNINLRFSGKKDIVHKTNEALKHKIFLNTKFKKNKEPKQYISCGP